MNGYFQWKLTTTFHLGPTADEKLYAVSTHTIVLGNKPSVVLHDGLTDKHPVLATAHGDRIPTRRCPCGRDGSRVIEENVAHLYIQGLRGLQGDSEGGAFEWRQSHGNEIKELAGHSFGWKLVRLTGPMDTAGRSRKERDRGYTSDGLEFVAVIAHNASWSMTKGFRFAFTGSGLTGTLWEVWEILVVLSVLEMWYLDAQRSAAAASSASATSAAAAS
ncbi:hypothetical protein N7499_001390 [Penicillium canescens]|uniref:Uncharacterized protein n=1 Tax=Penicillium canescens TaxID=5083 RepID=A0AAD6N400_PENCN|nr:uncharacterized protein N7446_003470 [Penicillium canescens]KAJ6008559.1 hypothetical protein N7522_003575 [Penicillium canescens]KAJ6027929.1 hypothetical protein N7460_012746 [Penicillium canescens]KAJ6041215.1 hypothetical protein N7444_010120 [Penicillium canescens]KAJ6066433.1 hypothetical protein N7446_003470 [Penicillium canescens]KAJ6101760.1 hypothetical protein N7499_001390 [Penicillium canescens]